MQIRLVFVTLEASVYRNLFKWLKVLGYHLNLLVTLFVAEADSNLLFGILCWEVLFCPLPSSPDTKKASANQSACPPPGERHLCEIMASDRQHFPLSEHTCTPLAHTRPCCSCHCHPVIKTRLTQQRKWLHTLKDPEPAQWQNIWALALITETMIYLGAEDLPPAQSLSAFAVMKS